MRILPKFVLTALAGGLLTVALAPKASAAPLQ